ncbi:hypothetical protein SAMN06297387_11772 [Streptomyces zhaozhouensis]|uniref:HTH luxR-type domain-containing protein n=1 Tax=Streptomyces zhaozhouensis TaxID=1300267 RepID=A0A286E0S7_9ACTN|nr:LuxR family transcriptional regulator [Streptomyces zhaozhouensis]SOD64506.1 hypothetical protein SAMN06297387_11772 [Streptomyces zhaozhouensis]
MERTLLEATALIDTAVTACRRRPTARSAVRHLDGSQLRATARRLIDEADHFVVVTTSGRPDLTTLLAGGLRSLEAARARGVPARVLLAPRVVRASRARLLALAADGCEIRVDAGEPREILLVDGVLALIVPARDADGQRPALVRDPAMVGVTCQLLKGTWNAARPLRDFHGAVARLRAEPAQDVLRCLHDGLTDEAAARRMSVSLRTYRRKVAQIMEELGITSRFQAGLRAAELGVLPAGDS